MKKLDAQQGMIYLKKVEIACSMGKTADKMFPGTKAPNNNYTSPRVQHNY